MGTESRSQRRPDIDIMPPAFRRLALAGNQRPGKPPADGAGQKLWHMLAVATPSTGKGTPIRARV